MTPRYTVSILCYNRAAFTRACLHSVLVYSPPDTQIICTNNGSHDGTASVLRQFAQRDKRIEIVTHPENVGITRGKNHALSLARGEWFVSLDNDAKVGDGWLDALRSGFTGRVQQVGRAGTNRSLRPEGVGYPGHELEYIDGSVSMVRTAYIRALPGGYCDPIFPFAYCEDADLSLRIRDQGDEIAVVNLNVYHPAEPRKLNHGGVPGLDQHHGRQQGIFRERWGGYLMTKGPHIVLSRAGAIGDILLMTPLPRLLKAQNPGRAVIVATHLDGLFASNPYVNAIVPLGTRFPGRNVVKLDLIYERKPQKHPFLAYAEAAGLPADTPLLPPELYIDERQHIPAFAEARAMLAGRWPAMVIHAGPTAWPGRNVPMPVWAEVVRRAPSWWHRFTVGETQFPGATHLGMPRLRALYALMKLADLFVGIDSMPFHMAQAAHTPSIVAFGCISPEARIANGNVAAVTVPLDCIGCHHRQPPPRVTWSGCARSDLACMTGLTADQFLEHVGKFERHAATV
jgi:glycosyltransferase involved in cell wall biosynthesis